MPRFGPTLGFILAMLPIALSGCSGDCSSAEDCAAGEVCYLEVCTPAKSSFYNSGGQSTSGGCDCNAQCNNRGCGEPPEPGRTDQAVCRAGRCYLKPAGGVIINTDASVGDSAGGMDSSTPDSGADAGTTD